MRDYELILILHPELEETVLNENVEKVKGWIEEAGGTVAKVDFWGRRQLAYEIQKQRDGQYVLFQYQSDPGVGTVLEQNLRLTEPVMRFLISQV